MFIQHQSFNGLGAEIQGPVRPGDSPLNPPSFWSGLLPALSTAAKAELERVAKRGISIKGKTYAAPSTPTVQKSRLDVIHTTVSYLPLIGSIAVVGVLAFFVLKKK